MKHLEPKAAWVYLRSHAEALFVDVRMEIEYLYVGHPPRIVHIPWYEYPEMHVDPARYAALVAQEAGAKTRPVMLLCRSGARGMAAGAALEAAGFAEVVNVTHGFEGDLDEHFQRGNLNGWRHDGLPWEQM